MGFPSKRKQILDRVEQLLATITVANGFPIDINKISHEVLDIQKINFEDTPSFALSIGSGGSNTFITTGSNVDSIVNIIIDGYIYVQPDEDVVEELDNLMTSMEQAILAGTVDTPWNDKYLTASLNGLIFVYFVSFDEQSNTDEGQLSLNKKGWFRQSLTVKYLKSTTNP